MLERIQKIDTIRNSTENLKNEKICPICRGTGWEFIADNGQGTCVKCKCGIRDQKIASNRILFANVPETFKEMSLESFQTDVYTDDKSRNKARIALSAVKYWLSDFDAMKERGMGLYFYSNTKGSGKTRMAASIANYLINDKKIQVKFSTSLQILNEIKASWEKSEKEYTESKLLGFLTTTDVLVIDDFGTEQSEKAWINERFYHIINSRYVNKKITIFTSNFHIGELKYEDRITNRIKERTFQVPFPDESVRELIAQENFKELVSGIKRVGIQ